MSIRLHKAIGYGLDDVIFHTDKRIDWESRVFTSERAVAGLEYSRWLDHRYVTGQDKARVHHSMDRIMLRQKDAAGELLRSRVNDCIDYNDEDRFSRVLLVRPFWKPDWHRYDDTLDFTAERLHEGFGKPRVEVLGTGIFPYDSEFMDADTGDRMPYGTARWREITVSLASQPLKGVTREERAKGLQEVTDLMLPELGWTYSEAARRIVPAVPLEVRDVCEFLRLFSGPDVWRELRPMAWTWWA